MPVTMTQDDPGRRLKVSTAHPWLDCKVLKSSILTFLPHDRVPEPKVTLRELWGCRR